MAYDRQQILRVVSGLLASGVVATIVATTIVATTSITAPVVNGQNTGGTGTCGTDYCAAAADELLVQAPAKVTSEVPTGGKLEATTTAATVTAASAGDDVTVSAADDVFLVSGDIMSIESTAGGLDLQCQTNSTYTCDGAITLTGGLASSIVAIDANGVDISQGDGHLVVDTGAVSILANGAGDDVSIQGNDVVTMSSGAMGNYFQADNGGAYINTAAAGDDITITTLDQFSAATSTGGQLQTVTGGVNILAVSTGDQIVIQTGTTGGINLDSGDITRTLVTGGASSRLPTMTRALTAAFTPGSTAEVAADTYSIAASQWTTTGETLEVIAWGTTSGNTNAKIWQLRLGASGACVSGPGTSVGSVNWNVATDTNVYATWRISRSAANTQLGMMQAASGGAAGTFAVNGNTSAARTESAIIDACVTVTNATAAGDSVVRGVQWRWY